MESGGWKENRAATDQPRGGDTGPGSPSSWRASDSLAGGGGSAGPARNRVLQDSLDPRSSTLEVWRLDEGRWREVDTWEGDGPVRAEPFEAMEMDLASLWGRRAR
jgi:hypothetical protein